METVTPTPFLSPIGDDDYELCVDNSSKELFETCARAAEYYNVYRREGAAERPALFRGTVLHHALAIRKLRPHDDFQPLQIDYILEAYRDKDFGEDEWRTAERAIDTIILYNKQWPIESEPFVVIEGSVEKPFKILLGTAELNTHIPGIGYVRNVRIYWTGILDGLVDYSQLFVLDHKSTSVLGPTFFDDFVLSSQMHGYVWSARKIGYPDCAGLYLDVLASRKPTKTGIANEFQRQRYYYNDAHLAEWERDTFTLIEDFLEHLCRGYFPKSPKWCFGKYGRCQYWDVCTQPPENRQDVIESDLYKPVTWSPLSPTL